MNVITLLTPKAQVACLNEEWTVRQGLEKLRVGGYTALPVLSREGMYVGTVSEGDFLWNMLDDQNNTLRSMEQRPLKTIMRPGFNPAVSVRVSMADLLDQAMRQSFVPVVDDRGAFVGIVTRQTIMRKLAKPQIKAEHPSDMALA
ncbi:MAG: CBS domain-containing protein [Oscillospiraceae bacterium]|nr:CBS domain-containing protein [Oscillospiraceae bacterium]